MSIASEAARAFFARERLGVDPSVSLSASVMTREHKLFSGLILVPLILPYALMGSGAFLLVMMSFLGIFVALLFLRSFRWDLWKNVLKRVGLSCLQQDLKKLGSSVKGRESFLICLAFIIAFLSESFSLYFCLKSVGINTGYRTALALYTTLFFLSKAMAYLPSGVGLVEPAGIIFLNPHKTAEVSAAMVLWDSTRLGVPLLISCIILIGLMLKDHLTRETAVKKTTSRYPRKSP